MVLLERDASSARRVARQNLRIYLGLSNYQASLRWLGFSDADFQDGGSDRLVDAIVAWGDERAIAARIRAHHDAGADHVCIQPFRPDGRPGPDPRILEALAPGSAGG
jgi:probable F420-dependent oxidoreductase